MKEKTKDVSIGGNKFRIGRFSPAVGAWIVNQTLTRRTGDFEVYQKIQGHCLETCSLVDADPQKPAMRAFADGQWALPELRDMPVEEVRELCLKVLDFNLRSFFESTNAKIEAGEKPDEISQLLNMIQ